MATRSGFRSLSAALVVAGLSACGVEPPDVGTVDPVFAPPAENVEVLALAPRQTFGDLLYEHMSANEQASLLLAFREHASPRRMKANTEVTFRYLPDGGALRGVDVEISPDRTVRLDRDELGWRSALIETPVYVDTLYSTGEVRSDLWSAVVNNPELSSLSFADRNELIDHLDGVFQWQVDFHRQIRVGDTYRFAFEREVRPDGSMRAGKLLAAEFVNSGTPYHAIFFDPNGDGDGSYYDLEGESVRRAFLLRPLTYRRISGRFQAGRFHPILQTWRAHRGVDYAADAGTPIMATSDGVVIHRGWKGSFGNTVELRHPNGWVTRYAHLRSFKNDVVLGTRVRQSDIIGYVGMTGLATGNHLHYGDPVPSDDRTRWRAEMASRVSLIESIPLAGPVRSVIAAAEDREELDAPQEEQEDGAQRPEGGSR